MKYFHWKEKTIIDFSLNNIEYMYENGFIFTRISKGLMHQTRSLRLNIGDFELSSENRRILKKMPGISMKQLSLPLPQYDFTIGKMAKDFYDTKFGPGIMSAQKIKEMLTDENKSNFNLLLKFENDNSTHPTTGYTITYSSPSILHYSYPFYNLEYPKDTGMIMMLMAIQHAKISNLKYIYLGSLQRPTDTYKLQFSGLEWFDGTTWCKDLDLAKKILASIDA